MDFEFSLLCCEEISSSPSVAEASSPSSSSFQNEGFGTYYAMHPHLSDQEDELTIGVLLSKQAEYIPDEGYSANIQCNPSLCESRVHAARWMIKAHSVHRFSPFTVAMAMNYLDRYLQKSFSLPWKTWMMELLSVACLSVAAKMEEVDVPALLDLQVEGMEHFFQAKTVQRMELNVLGALGWRLRCVTPFSFVEKAIDHLDIHQKLKCSLMARISELILGTLSEIVFLEFEPSTLAVTSICCALEEVIPLQADLLKLSLYKYIPLDEDIIRRCYILMEALIVDPLISTSFFSEHEKSPLSPNTVICCEEESSSVDDGDGGHTFLLISKVHVKRSHPQEDVCQSYPKRQRGA